MSIIKGIADIALGLCEGTNGSIKYDGATSFCPKCNMPYVGVCKSCSSQRSMEHIQRGIDELKEAADNN